MNLPSRLFKAGCLVFAIVVFVSLSALPAQAQIKIFVRVDGIEGESTDQHHKDWIDAAACSDGITMPITIGAGGGSSAKAAFSPIRILKAIDKSSTGLRDKAVVGRYIKDVNIEFTRSIGGQSVKYQEITLVGVFVTEISMTTQIPDISQEVVAFDFEEIEWTYTQLRADGSAVGATTFKWNRVTGSR